MPVLEHFRHTALARRGMTRSRQLSFAKNKSNSFLLLFLLPLLGLWLQPCIFSPQGGNLFRPRSATHFETTVKGRGYHQLEASKELLEELTDSRGFVFRAAGLFFLPLG